MPDDPKGLFSTRTSINQNTSESFYVRTKDAFFEGVNPNNEIFIDTKDKNEEIKIDNDEVWYEHFSTVIPSEEGQQTYRYKVNGRYEYKHAHKYDSKNVVGEIAEQIAKKISENIKNNTLEYIGIKESRKKGKIEPAVRIMLGDLTKKINMVDILNGDTCKKYGIGGITLLLPTEDKYEKRGIRCRIDEHGTRIYEVANGSYEMDLKWCVEGEECNIKIGISDDGPVELLENKNGVTWKQIAAHKEIKVGGQYKAQSLYAALSYLQQEACETLLPKVTPKPQVAFEKVKLIPSTNVTDTNEPQQHQPHIVAKLIDK
ncbi:hypothetical protein [Wolbachia endosymbiont of Cantharis cryptica]|uniref:hypothetical protein n=1 Tax=Wolbachia endosymbiont of Cantharis cryptica TaxID=3066132 RepID=UPI00376F45F0